MSGIFFGVAAVVFHVSAPYNRTAFTVVLKILMLMLMVRLGGWLFPTVDYSTSASAPPPPPSTLPLFVNNAT